LIFIKKYLMVKERIQMVVILRERSLSRTNTGKNTTITAMVQLLIIIR